MTEEELFSIVTTAITKSVEPLELQIANLKQLNVDLSAELSELKEKLIEDAITLKDNQSNTGTAILKVVDELVIKDSEIDDLKCSVAEEINNTVEALEHIKSGQVVINQQLNESLNGFISDNKEAQLEFETRVLADVTLFKDNIDTAFEDGSSDFNDLVKHTNESTLDTINNKFETLDLKVMNVINKEHLRLNDHVNASLINLKGEKGDTGEKGEEGESGFVRGISVWETGCISKQRETVSHKNSLWLCNAEQSAHEPGHSDDYSLIVDGVIEHSVDDEGHLISKYASGKSADLGRILMMFRGDYDEKATYNKMDLVRLNGNIFRCLRDGNTTRPPSGSKDWEKMMPRGEKGLKGAKGDSPAPVDFVAAVNDALDVRLGSE